MRLLILGLVFSFFAAAHAVKPTADSKSSERLPEEMEINALSLFGSILDQETGEKLVCAKIEIEETGISLFSDIRGDFLVSELKPGTYNLRVSYISYREKELTLTIEESTDQLEIMLQPL
jgi:hypothetical protein